MTSLFISPDSDIKVEFWISQSSRNQFESWDSETVAMNSDAGKERPKDIIRIEAHFREPTFRDTTEIADIALAMDSNGSFSMSVNQVRMERLIRLLKTWNLQSEDGKPIQPNRQNVSQLHPQVAFLLAAALEDRLGMSLPPEEKEFDQ